MDKDKKEKEFKHNITPVDEGVQQPEQRRMQEILGMFQTVTAAPTVTPFNWQNQIQIYSSGGTFRIYIYDTASNAWKYATLT